jgi:hypothetical protein
VAVAVAAAEKERLPISRAAQSAILKTYGRPASVLPVVAVVAAAVLQQQQVTVAAVPAVPMAAVEQVPE